MSWSKIAQYLPSFSNFRDRPRYADNIVRWSRCASFTPNFPCVECGSVDAPLIALRLKLMAAKGENKNIKHVLKFEQCLQL